MVDGRWILRVEKVSRFGQVHPAQDRTACRRLDEKRSDGNT